MNMRLIDLYRPSLLEVSGRSLNLQDFSDDVKVAWDDFAQKQGVTTASFIERSGRIYANTKGHGWFEWDGVTWRRAEKPGPSTGPQTGRYQAKDWGNPAAGVQPGTDSLFDVFSKDFAGFRNNVSQAMAKLFGKDWEKTVEQVYGKGAPHRAFSEMWRYFYTDHEALGELTHYYDQARTQIANEDAVVYGLVLGPKYDWNGYEGVLRTRRIESIADFPERVPFSNG